MITDPNPCILELLQDSVIVHSDGEDCVIVSWDEALTFQFWAVDPTNRETWFLEFHKVTLASQPASFEAAREIAKSLYEEHLEADGYPDESRFPETDNVSPI